MYFALILSRLALTVGITTLVLSWASTRYGRRWTLSRRTATVLALIGLGLIILAWGLAVASRQR